MKQRWLPRSLWLLAWSFWAWLGWGLYRELPRDLGPALYSFDFDENEYPFGFLDDLLVTQKEDFEIEGQPSRVRLYDADTGKLRVDWKGPIAPRPFQGGQLSLRHGVMVVPQANVPGSTSNDDRSALLDLKTGKWADLGPESSRFPSFHSTRPWCLFWKTGEDGGSVSVFDLQSRELLLQWRRGGGVGDGLLAGMPFFVGEQIAVPVERRGSTNDERMREIELWSIPERRRTGVFSNVPTWSPSSVSLTGRAAWATAWFNEGKQGRSVLVYDFTTARTVFTRVPEGVVPLSGLPSHGPGGTELSANGRTVMDDGPPTKLWDIDTGRPIWEQKGSELQRGVVDQTFQTDETWAFKFVDQQFEFKTYASRRLDDGGLIVRSWRLLPTIVNGAHSLCFDYRTGSVHPWPHLVNWPLLALCQTILALPLILVWSLLRWRRNRKLRLASVQP